MASRHDVDDLAYEVDTGFQLNDDDDIRPPHRIFTRPDVLYKVFSYVDDPADLARVCQTSKMMYYICRPALYEHVRLRSYDEVHFSPETMRPSGVGGPTPFQTGLIALTTGNVNPLVKSLEICGRWSDPERGTAARAGLVPDKSVMLSTLVRIAIDKTNLESFKWNIDTKMLRSVWDGLVLKERLTSLYVRFPNDRTPMPVFDVPPMPHLKSLTITHIDPLCYPDSISEILFGSKKLQHLVLHWSPRMREERESSINPVNYFGRIFSENYHMSLKTLELQNFYSPHEGLLPRIARPDRIESYTLINSMPGENDGADQNIVSYTWTQAPPLKMHMPNLRRLRGDKVSNRHCDVLLKLKGLQEYYQITGRVYEEPLDDANTPMDSSSGPHSPRSGTDAQSVRSAPFGTYSWQHMRQGTISSSTQFNPMVYWDQRIQALGPAYLGAIRTSHGATLRNLLLMPYWKLDSKSLTRLLHSCPVLEQLGFTPDTEDWEAIKCLDVLDAPRLRAVRFLDVPDDQRSRSISAAASSSRGTSYALTPSASENSPSEDSPINTKDEKWHVSAISTNFKTLSAGTRIKWIGRGPWAFHVRRKGALLNLNDKQLKEQRWQGSVERVRLHVMRNVPIWGLDTLDVSPLY